MYLVTGASSGIGRSVACELLKRGFSVASVARRSMSSSVLSQYGKQVISINADVTTESGLNTIASVLTGRLVHGVVHAAGSHIALASYAHLNSESMNRDMSVHVSAPIAINNRLAQQLEGVRIIYIDSYSANAPRVGWSGYSIVKAAAQMAAKSGVAEMSHTRIIRGFPGGVKMPLVEAVLNSEFTSTTALAFRELDAKGDIVEPAGIGRYITDILVLATDQQLEVREFWDFNNPADRVF
ncbi:MAG: benzil reductase ((S)-benzoin forming) [Porticoccaceae bacterium]|jgi:NAD(P)-dependent dehydrogenase (short-subunit alcohol dehydrogenase family)